MIKKLIYAILPLLIICLSSCATDVPDDKNSLPTVNTKQYAVENTPNAFKFPKGTPALDVYSTLYEAVGDLESAIEVTGKYTLTRSYQFPDTKPSSLKHEYEIKTLNINRSHSEASNSFNVIMTTDTPAYIKKGNDWVIRGVVTASFTYQWQLHNTHEWYNNKSEGPIEITIPTKYLKK